MFDNELFNSDKFSLLEVEKTKIINNITIGIGISVTSVIFWWIKNMYTNKNKIDLTNTFNLKTEIIKQELINIFEVTNLNTSLKYLKSKNFWISGFDTDGSKNFTENDWKGKNVLLFGSEGEGLKFQIKKNADFLFYINIDKKVESLNVSNSASIVFHHINRKINSK